MQKRFSMVMVFACADYQVDGVMLLGLAGLGCYLHEYPEVRPRELAGLNWTQ